MEQVSAAEIEERANAEGIMFIETSAKDGFNVKLLFRRLATALPSLDAPAAAADPQVVNLTAPPPLAAGAGGGNAGGGNAEQGGGGLYGGCNC